MRNRESKTKKKKKNAKSRYLPKLSCLRTEPDGEGNFDMQVQTIGDGNGDSPTPTHLVVMVNGIIGRLVGLISLSLITLLINTLSHHDHGHDSRFDLFCLFIYYLQCSKLEIRCQAVLLQVS